MAFEGLPEELITLILAKLPVKSLLRFKCVRKSWYSLIESPQFIQLHRSSSSSSSSPQFVFRRCVKEEPGHVLSFYSYETLDDLGNDIDIPISNGGDVWLSSISNGGDVWLSGSCDGLVCITNRYDHGYNLTIDTDQILICNPAIREFRSLFIPPLSDYHIDSVAFGSDPNTGQYKVVMIGVPRAGCDREAQVYDFSTDSWRDTAVVIPAPFCYSRLAVSLNGAFHWCPITSAIFERDESILRFRFCDEVTDSIPLPDFLNVSRGLVKELSVISSLSQLSLIVYDFDLRGGFEICVMTEYGVKESWNRLLQIGPLSDICEHLAFWDEQQLLLLTKEGLQLVSCDLQHQNNLRYFPIYAIYENFDVYSYSESLVSVNGIRE